MHIDRTSVHKSSWSLTTDMSVTTQKDTKSSPISRQNPATLICRFSGENENVLPCKTNLLGYNHMAQMVASLQLPVAEIQHCTLRAFPFYTKPRVEAPPAPLAPSPPCFLHTHRLWRSRRSAVGWILTTKEQRRERRGGRQSAEVHKSSFPVLEEETFAVRGETTTLAFQNIKRQRSPRLAVNPRETRDPAKAAKHRGGLGGGL